MLTHAVVRLDVCACREWDSSGTSTWRQQWAQTLECGGGQRHWRERVRKCRILLVTHTSKLESPGYILPGFSTFQTSDTGTFMTSPGNFYLPQFLLSCRHDVPCRPFCNQTVSNSPGNWLSVCFLNLCISVHYQKTLHTLHRDPWATAVLKLCI